MDEDLGAVETLNSAPTPEELKRIEQMAVILSLMPILALTRSEFDILANEYSQCECIRSQ